MDAVDAEEYVMYILINKDLGMRPGKMASQVGHGVQAIVASCERAIAGGTTMDVRLLNYVGWSACPTKIVLKASEEEMIRLAEKNKDDVFTVYDEGRTTQVASGSFTALGFYPLPLSEETKKRFEAFKLVS